MTSTTVRSLTDAELMAKLDSLTDEECRQLLHEILETAEPDSPARRIIAERLTDKAATLFDE